MLVINPISVTCAQTKQVLCDIGLRDSYRTLTTVDINSGRDKIFENEKTEWVENVSELVTTQN